MRILNEAKARLKKVEEGIAELQKSFEETMKKKEELKEKCDLCTARLERAEKVCVCVYVCVCVCVCVCVFNLSFYVDYRIYQQLYATACVCMRYVSNQTSNCACSRSNILIRS